MAELPIMPLYTDAWSGDVSDLPNALYGAYMRLIVRWWREGAMPEPNEKKLARWAGLSSSEFEDLKEFLEETEKGFIQRKMMKTYAEQLTKSIKAQKSANARYKKSERSEDYDKRMSDAYAQRMLSMIHDPSSKVEEANASSPKEKNKYKKKKSGGVSAPRGTIDVPLPDDPDARKLVERFMAKRGAAAVSTWLTFDGACAVEKFGEEYLISAESSIKADMIEQRFGADFNEWVGRGNWKTTVRAASEKAAA